MAGHLYETDVWLDGEGRLLQQRRPLGWGQEVGAAPEVLLDNLASLTFSYSPCPSEAQVADARRWTSVSQLPFLISITGSFREGDRREWKTVSAFIPAAACAIGK